MSNEFKFQPTAVADAVNKKVVINRLPEWMQSVEHIQMYFDNAIQPWFTPEEQELVDGYIGDRGSPAAAGRIFLPERDVQREEYQLSPAYVSRNNDRSVRSLQFYPDLIGYLNHYGSVTDNESRLLDGNFYSWTPAINPNKLLNFSAYVWDTQNEYGIEPDYIVMERDSLNGNTWSLQNYWYTVGDTMPDGKVLSVSDMTSSRFSRARGPIIEFNKNIELVNYGSRFRSVVDYFSDSLKPEDIAQRRVSDNIRIDGEIIKEGDRILFTSIGNSGENNRIYTIHVKLMPDGTQVYGITLDDSEFSVARPTGEPEKGDVVLVRSGATFANSSFYWTGRYWAETQRKTGINVFPQFVLYDADGTVLGDTNKYPKSTFSGSNLFGFKINYDYPVDNVFGYHIELSTHNYYIFENYLQTQRYEYNVNDEMVEIPGLYFYKLITEDTSGNTVEKLQTDWKRLDFNSKQYVRQVPSIEKTSMFKVFESLSDMNKFDKPLEFMYAYVVEIDQTYRYLKTNGELNWKAISTDAVQSDVYNKSFELAQRIDLNNSDDEIEIMADGVVVRDYSTVLDANGLVKNVTLGDSITLTDTSIISIRTYSKTQVPDKTLGAYEIPLNLKNNPHNEVIDYIHQGEYTQHFSEIINKNITYGSVNDFNDYEQRLRSGLVDNSVGTYIVQNEAPLLPLMIASANENLDIFKAIQFAQMDYFRFKNKFNSRMLSMYESDREGFLKMTASNIVDTVLKAINIGKDESFPFYYSTVGATSNVKKTFIPSTPQFFGILKSFEPQSNQYLQMGASMSWYNIDHTGAVSKSYRVLNGITLMDDALLELETRIYESIDSSFREIDYIPIMDSTELKPTAHYTSTEYTRDEYDTIMLRGYTNFIATNGIDGSTHAYRQQDWTTWNFTGCTYVIDDQPSTISARGSWRGIFMDMYGTWRPHTHPWEMFGFTQRPTWWNLQYEATRVQVGAETNDYVIVYKDVVENENGDYVPSGLWDVGSEKGDASKGIILQGTRAGTHQKYRRFGKQPFVIKGTGTFASNGKEISTVEMINPVELGMISGSLNHLAEPWVFGDMGDIEFSYMNTPMFVFDNAMALLRAKPARFMTYYFDIMNSKLITLVGNEKQFLYKQTRERMDLNSSTLVHSENGYTVLGWQQWVSDYLIWQNKDVTKNFGDVLRSSSINIGHRIGAFSKADNIQFNSETFGNISQENQYIGMVKSSVIDSTALSAVKITYTGSGYTVSGYDLVNPYFKVQIPNKTGRRNTIQSGKRRVVQYFEYKDSTENVKYGTEMKSFQDVYTFICSYGKALENAGWIFEDTDTNGELFNWNRMANEYLEWSSTSPSKGEFISITTSASSAKFGATFGSVQSVTQFSGGVWSLLDDQNTGIRPDEIDTVRIGNVFSIRTLDESTRRIALIRLNVITFEHAVVFDNQTIFGDDLYIPKYGSIYEMLKMYGYITGSWNGRLEAPGFMVLETGTLPNFEKLVNDFTQYYDNSNPVDDSTLRKLSRHLIGFQTRDYISQMITNESAQVDFYRGFISEKGTRQSFEKVLRVSKTYNTENYQALEEWAFKLGTFGDVYGKKHLQFQLINNEFTQEPQLFVSDENATSDTADNTILHYGSQGIDERWVARPRGSYKFPLRYGRSNRISLPDIGPVTLNEVDYSTVSFESAYASRAAFVYQMNKQPQRVWMFRDPTQNWTIYNVVEKQVRLLRIEPISYEGVDNQYCVLTFLENHGLKNGDWFFLNDKNNYMPDSLKKEMQFYGNTDDANTIIVPLALANSIIFGTVTENTVTLTYNDISLNANFPGSTTPGTKVETYTVSISNITLDGTEGSDGDITSGTTVMGTISVQVETPPEGDNGSGDIIIGDSHSAIINTGSDSDIDNCPVLYMYEPYFQSSAAKQNYVTNKYSYGAPETALFERPSTYNSLTNGTELYMNVYDPINGVIPGAVMSEVKYISSYDPAMYNSDNAYNTMAWGSEHVGKVWWDTTSAFYLDYTRPVMTNGVVDSAKTLEYARYNWGRLMNGSSIDVYEWVASPVPPYEWDAYCTKQAKLNKNTQSWVASGTALEENYSVFDEYDEVTSSYKTVYYFWVKDSIYVPEVSTRRKSVNEIARAIKNPSVLNVPWFSPVSDSAFITSELQGNITDDKSILTITWQMNDTDVVKHEQYQLCKEGLDYNFNPQVWNSMWNSLIGSETMSNGTVNYLQYPTTDLGAEPGKIWFKDIVEARREFVSAANNIYRTLNVQTDTILMSDVFNMKYTTRNPYQVDISILKVNDEFVISAPGNSFAENDTVILSSTGTLPSPLSNANVYFVTNGSDGYIRLMNSPGTSTSKQIVTIYDKGVGSHSMIPQAYYDSELGTSLDMTKFWETSDWYSDGYSSSTLYSQETSTTAADTKNYQEGDVIRVTGTDGIWTLYVKSSTRNKTMWQAVGRQNSTVKLNSELFSGYDMFDTNGNLTTKEKAVRQALALLKDSFDTLQSRLVFDMVKYVHNEQNVVDWVFKTSYIFVVGLEQSLQRDYLQQDDLITQIVEYFQEVKPYHTKIRSQIEQKTSDEDEVVGIANDLNPSGYDVNGNKTENDVWDHEYAQYNDTLGVWEVQGSLPDNFSTPDRSFQEIDVQMYFDNMQVNYDTDLPEAYILENVNNKYVNTSKDLQITGTHYKLSRFSFDLPELQMSTVEMSIKSTLVARYPAFNVSLALESAISQMANTLSGSELEKFMSDVDAIMNSALKSNSTYKEYRQFSQYNTLVNRLKLYTSLSDEQIANAIKSPFKGRVVDDNPNTRLPSGYSSSNDENFGYVLSTKELYESLYNASVAIVGTSASKDRVLEYMRYEFGIYDWKHDMDTQGPSYMDTLYVLTAVREMRSTEDSDPMSEAEAILDYYKFSREYGFVLPPRKYFKAKNASTGTFVEVPMSKSIDVFLEEQYIDAHESYTLYAPNLNDIPVQDNNPLYSTFKEILTSDDGTEHINDLNGYDSSGYEDMYKTIVHTVTGTALQSTEPMFISIARENPNAEEISEIRFSVQGYSDTEHSLRTLGRGTVPGAVIQNPYDRTEVLVSIPSYSSALSLMNANLWETTPPKYLYKVTAVTGTNGVFTVQDNDFRVGDKVAIFTPGGENYDVQNIDGSWSTVLKVDNIKTGNRPTIFSVSSVSGNTVRINGLTFETAMKLGDASGITVYRVNSFADNAFTSDGQALYMDDRRYTITIMNYDLLYDRMVTAPSFSTAMDENDLDGWYTSNEHVTLDDGTEVDNGFFMPVNDEGTLSELVRTKVTEFVQFTVIEYDADTINPVMVDNANENTTSWQYSVPLTNGVYAEGTESKAYVMYSGLDVNGWLLAVPQTHVTGTFVDNNIKLNVMPQANAVLLCNSELMQSRSNGYVLRGIHNSVENNFNKGETYNVDMFNLGPEISMSTYSTGSFTIPQNQMSTSYTVRVNEYPAILGA